MTASDGDRFADARAVADAVLLEGYLLYPYRRTSPKNRVRFQFGVLLPRSCAAPSAVDRAVQAVPHVAGSVESWYQQTETLVEPGRDGGGIDVRVRFLQLQRRTVERRAASGWQPVDRLEAGGAVNIPFDEAVERVLPLSLQWSGALETAEPRSAEIAACVTGGEDVEEVAGAGGGVIGRVLRRRSPLEVRVDVSIERLVAPFPLARLRVRTENRADADPAGGRDHLLTRSLLATHTMMAAQGAAFVSLLDPPAWATPATEACQNHHTFPVLVGGDGVRALLLSSPIILYDHPAVSPQSPGDLCDATEIDEILTLRTLTLTEEEKAEARATDPRAALIVDRVDALPPEVFARLHGVIRSLDSLGTPPAGAEGGDAHAGDGWVSEVVLGSGERARAGSLVSLEPRGSGTDAADIFLSGKVARLEAVRHDVDGRVHVAVTLPDDPGEDLQRWYGRYLYFSPDELRLAGAGAAAHPPAPGSPGVQP